MRIRLPALLLALLMSLSACSDDDPAPSDTGGPDAGDADATDEPETTDVPDLASEPDVPDVECTASSDCEATERCVERACVSAVEGSDCTGDDTCPGDLYCVSQGICQDGSTGDLCDETSDCADANDLCDTICRARDSGEACGPGDTCPGELQCVASVCRAGQTGDACATNDDCFEPGDECVGDPLVCTTVAVLGELCDSDNPCATGLTCSNDACAPEGFAYIPAGMFEMGSPESEPGRLDREGPVHEVTLTGPFFLSETETTQAQWGALMGNSPSEFTACGTDCPVENVSWVDALAYANALSADEGLAECYDLSACTGTPGVDFACSDLGVNAPGGLLYLCEGYRLPTEAEWEYAYRAGTSTAFYNGDITVTGCGVDANLDAIGWYCGNGSNTTHPIGDKSANPRGLFDMSGNVSEWVWDSYDEGYYAFSPAEDPQGTTTGISLVTRGGSWAATAAESRAAQRFFAAGDTRNDFIGFRVARTVPVDDTCVEDGVCERRRETAASCPADCATLDDACDPFEPFPVGSCEAPFWCEPTDVEGIEGVCVGVRAGGLTQGSVCTDSSECATGHVCPGLGECIRYCDRTADPDATCDGEQLQCQEAYDEENQGLDLPFGYCRETCDFDADGICASEGRACSPGELVTTGNDLCFDATAFNGADAWLEPGDNCSSNGFAEDAFCGGLAYCISDTCTAFCRFGAGIADVTDHPDCDFNEGCSSSIGFPDLSIGICEQRCDTVTPLLNETFNFEFDRGNLVGDVVKVGWADYDFPNIADDETTGGTDDDAGIAFQGWIDGGSGFYAYNQEAIDIISSPGTVFYAHADIHVEQGFNPSVFRLEVTWFGAEVRPGVFPTVGSDDLDLLPLLTPGNDATDHAEWRQVGLESARPADAVLGQLQIIFGGTTDVGGLQAARIDNITFGLCSN